MADTTATPEALVEGKNLATDLSGSDRVLAEKRHASRMQEMAKWAETAERVDVRIPKVMGDQTVFINGYMFQIKAGETVKVPVEVRNILERGNRI